VIENQIADLQEQLKQLAAESKRLEAELERLNAERVALIRVRDDTALFSGADVPQPKPSN
jgi:cell division protein FtsB